MEVFLAESTVLFSVAIAAIIAVTLFLRQQVIVSITGRAFNHLMDFTSWRINGEYYFFGSHKQSFGYSYFEIRGAKL
jgi:hypothetical protein